MLFLKFGMSKTLKMKGWSHFVWNWSVHLDHTSRRLSRTQNTPSLNSTKSRKRPIRKELKSAPQNEKFYTERLYMEVVTPTITCESTMHCFTFYFFTSQLLLMEEWLCFWHSLALIERKIRKVGNNMKSWLCLSLFYLLWAKVVLVYISVAEIVQWKAIFIA